MQKTLLLALCIVGIVVAYVMDDAGVLSRPKFDSIHSIKGKHWTLDMFDIPQNGVEMLKDWGFLDTTVRKFIKSAGMHLLNVQKKIFEQGGVTAVWLISESHVSIHTWPEHQFAAVDVYTCGSADPSKIVKQFVNLFKPGRVVKHFIDRGVRQAPPKKITYPQTPYKTDLCVNGDEDTDWTLLKNTTVLARVKTPFQELKVIQTSKFGKCMVLDGAMQYCMSDNRRYTREIIDRPIKPFIKSEKPIRVLIIGGADAWVANRLLDKYSNIVKDITLVDIDKTVSEYTFKFFGHFFKTNAYTDRRVHFHYTDASKWLKTCLSNQYEMVIIDCTDNTRKVSQILYTQEFYNNVQRVMKSGGRIVQQMNTESDDLEPFFKKTARVWKRAGLSQLKKWTVSIPSFSGDSVYWMATKSRD